MKYPVLPPASPSPSTPFANLSLLSPTASHSANLSLLSPKLSTSASSFLSNTPTLVLSPNADSSSTIRMDIYTTLILNVDKTTTFYQRPIVHVPFFKSNKEGRQLGSLGNSVGILMVGVDAREILGIQVDQDIDEVSGVLFGPSPSPQWKQQHSSHLRSPLSSHRSSPILSLATTKSDPSSSHLYSFPTNPCIFISAEVIIDECLSHRPMSTSSPSPSLLLTQTLLKW
jgi:hypothetical protein